jgi:hypothetical protein
MNTPKDRLEELRAMSTLNDDEMHELIALCPPGSFLKLPNLVTAGLHDLDQALKNGTEIGDRTKRAFEHGFFIEVLALQSQAVELTLRLYLAAKLKCAPSFPVDDRRSLGGLVNDSEKVVLSQEVVAKLRAFNTNRIFGIHRYLLGSLPYEDLKELCEGSRELNKELMMAVAVDIGIPV